MLEGSRILAATGTPRAHLLAVVGLCALLQALPGGAQPQEAVERVELNGVVYDVPPPWRGHRIEGAADPAELVKVPADLTGELGIYVTPGTRDAIVAMAAAAREQGIRLEVDSGFRSYGSQKRILEGLLAAGRPFSDAVRWTAPPGYSEHVTGRAVDFVPSDGAFRDTAAYQWLRQHAASFCFTESYPLGNAGGFEWEPWHWRYDRCERRAEESGLPAPRRTSPLRDAARPETAEGVGAPRARAGSLRRSTCLAAVHG